LTKLGCVLSIELPLVICSHYSKEMGSNNNNLVSFNRIVLKYIDNTEHIKQHVS